jgi:hypothetical protein
VFVVPCNRGLDVCKIQSTFVFVCNNSTPICSRVQTHTRKHYDSHIDFIVCIFHISRYVSAPCKKYVLVVLHRYGGTTSVLIYIYDAPWLKFELRGRKLKRTKKPRGRGSMRNEECCNSISKRWSKWFCKAKFNYYQRKKLSNTLCICLSKLDSSPSLDSPIRRCPPSSRANATRPMRLFFLVVVWWWLGESSLLITQE